jgi:hypothetical protein
VHCSGLDSASSGSEEATYFSRHPDGRTTVVPVHAGETLGVGLLAKILRDAQLSRDEILELLR